MDWIEKLAREHGTGGWQTLDDMVRFGKAVAFRVREDCAVLCDEKATTRREYGFWQEAEVASELAEDIRARSDDQHNRTPDQGVPG